MVRKYIDAVLNDKAGPSISVLDAMTILTGAWNKIMPETIQNCFRKAGICSEPQINAIHDLENAMYMYGLEKVYETFSPGIRK